MFSRPGRHHVSYGQDNQDFIAYSENERYVSVALADGVSSCSRARAGAKIAASLTVSLMIREARDFFSMTHRQATFCLLENIRFELKKKAADDSASEEDYSSTISGVLFDKQEKKMFYCNLGDGLILVTGNDTYYVVAPPQDSRNGCCVTTTNNAEFCMQTGITDSMRIENVFICSDGTWKNLFVDGKLESDVRELMLIGSIENIQKRLESGYCFDDYSLVMMNVRNAA